ncbi:MAG: outer membrane lipoprotein carrier protein LolA [Candidatus Aminicenantes bacterium]|nr:outer membrane lipoprotein carrier protein LolA [Candidatus Aminicenantes bacterium]
MSLGPLRPAAFFFFLVILSVFGQTVPRQESEREILARTEQTLAALDSLQADFEQTYFSATVSTPLKDKGRLYYQKPGKMRWEYRGKSRQIIVLNDGILETFDPEDNQLLRRLLPADEANHAIFGLLTGQGRLTETYRVENSSFPGAEGSVHQLKLTPLEEGETSRILVEIDARTRLLRRVILFDWADNKNEFTFSRLRTNTRPAAGLFSIVVPEDCEIIDDTVPRKR